MNIHAERATKETYRLVDETGGLRGLAKLLTTGWWCLNDTNGIRLSKEIFVSPEMAAEAFELRLANEAPAASGVDGTASEVIQTSQKGPAVKLRAEKVIKAIYCILDESGRVRGVALALPDGKWSMNNANDERITDECFDSPDDVAKALGDRLAAAASAPKVKNAFKIIGTDNFNRETVADILVAENIQSEVFADTMREALQNRFGGRDASCYFKVVPQGHKLWRGMEEFV